MTDIWRWWWWWWWWWWWENYRARKQRAEGIMVDLWRDFWIRETGTGQQVTRLHDRYMMMMMMMMIMMMMRKLQSEETAGRRNHGRSLKRLLDTWDRNGSTSGQTAWQIFEDDDDNDDESYWFLRKVSVLIRSLDGETTNIYAFLNLRQMRPEILKHLFLSSVQH